MSASDMSPPRAERRILGEGVGRYLAALAAPKGVIGIGLLSTLALAALFAPILFPGGVDQQTRDSEVHLEVRLSPENWARFQSL